MAAHCRCLECRRVQRDPGSGVMHTVQPQRESTVRSNAVSQWHWYVQCRHPPRFRTGCESAFWAGDSGVWSLWKLYSHKVPIWTMDFDIIQGSASGSVLESAFPFPKGLKECLLLDCDAALLSGAPWLCKLPQITARIRGSWVRLIASAFLCSSQLLVSEVCWSHPSSFLWGLLCLVSLHCVATSS